MAIDLRSDTVSRPTAAMREAMARAEVGDDGWGDDPTVIALERAVAQRLGKAAGLFVPSGTMANQIAVQLHARPGELMATHPGAHVQIHEDASAAHLGGVQIMSIGTRQGYDIAALHDLCRHAACGWPRVGLAWLENTIGDAGGRLWPLEGGPHGATEIAAWVRGQGLAVHLDGARLWNAHVASGVDLARLAAVGDTVSVSLSKGLGAPAGSVLCGSEEHIAEGRRLRHGLGGTMRQAGILAAAGLHALEHHVARLAEDHRRARSLASALQDSRTWSVDPPATNIVIARLRDEPAGGSPGICDRLVQLGVLASPNRFDEVRFVLHLGIDDDALARVIETLARTFG